MAADNTGTKSSSAADSYVGSLISLTSKSEIRYEGILYNINTDESSIGLQNVRSFGTEGRKKDGPQVPPSDKVYEYILFRGTDIKDLQVKASPPVQSPPIINNDPAIIQSHYPSPMPTSSSLPPSTVGVSMPDTGSHNGQHGMGFQNSMPLYQPGGNLGQWGASPQPPMYWQGFYPPPPNGLPQLHQQSLIRPPQGISMPSSLQQPVQYPNFNASLPTGSSIMQGSSLLEASPPSFPYNTNSQIQAPSAAPPSAVPVPLSSGLQSTLPSAPSASQASEMSPPLLSNKAPVAAPLTLSQDTSLPPLSVSTTRAAETSPGLPLFNKPSISPGPVSMPQTAPLTSAILVGGSSSISLDQSKPLLVTPGQLLQSGSAAVSLSTPSQNTDNDVEVVQVSNSAGLEQSAPNTSEAQPPILPLPASARPAQQPNGLSFPSHNGYRRRGGRGRGAGGSHQVMKFTEDFDFTAMNEKFNKDEVWGHLGKNTKDGDGDYEYPVEDEAELPKTDAKPVYNKDDFFDSLSSNTLNRDSQNARPRFSEQRKLDTETFGEFSRSRGGRGYGRNGYSRGRGYGGRGGGYGYGGRGHVRGVSNRTF